MKNLLYILPFLFCCFSATSQDAYNSGGNYGASSSIKYTYTIGQPVIQTGALPNNYVTQGFNQPFGCFINPTVDAGSDLMICEESAVTLSGTGSTGITYSWDNSVLDGQSFVPTSSKTYKVTGTNASGCSSTDSITVTLQSVQVNAGADQSICDGDGITLSGQGAQNYTWTNGVSNGSLFTPSQTQTYVVTGTDNLGCSDTDSVTVTVNALPSVYAGANQSTCAGLSVTLSGSGNATTYTWDNGAVNNVPFVVNSTTTYTVTGTDNNGCVNTDQVLVTAIPSPQPNAGQDQSICIGSSVTLNATGASTLNWNNGVTNGVAFNPTVSQYYLVSSTNSNGCTGTDSVLVLVNPLPNVYAGQDVSICQGMTVMLNASGANTYSWNNGAINGQVFTPLNSNSYVVTGTDANGCVNSDTLQLTVHPLPNVGAGQDQVICLGDAITLSGSGANSYSWNNGAVNANSFVPSATTMFTVTGTDLNNCSNTAQVLVTVNPLPVVVAAASIDGVLQSEGELCSGDSLKLMGSGSAIEYIWDQGVVNASWFTSTATNTYTVTGTDNNNCENTDDILITVNELPEIISDIINEKLGFDGSIDITVTAGLPPYTFDWDNDGVGDNDDNQNITDLTGGTYQVTVTDDNACQKSFTIIVENMTALIIPSAITPNSDGVNDVWDIIGLHNYSNMQLQIFDRYGQIIHEQQGQYTNWNGQFRGINVPQGDYFYIIDLKNGEEPYKGAVSVKY